MILKDFMFLFEPLWSEKQKHLVFRNQTRCIASMYARLLGRYKNDKCFRIIIIGVETTSSQEIKCIGNCIEVQETFDLSIFADNVSKKEKKVYFLDKLIEGIRKVAEFENWDMTTFLDVDAQIRSLDYHNEWYWGKPVKSPNKSITAQIFLIHDIDAVDIYVVFKDKHKNELCRRHLISELPDEWNYAKYLGKLEWMSDDEIVLKDKMNECELHTKFKNHV